MFNKQISIGCQFRKTKTWVIIQYLFCLYNLIIPTELKQLSVTIQSTSRRHPPPWLNQNDLSENSYLLKVHIMTYSSGIIMREIFRNQMNCAGLEDQYSENQHSFFLTPWYRLLNRVTPFGNFRCLFIKLIHLSTLQSSFSSF